jgi:hypothetical protein
MERPDGPGDHHQLILQRRVRQLLYGRQVPFSAVKAGPHIAPDARSITRAAQLLGVCGKVLGERRRKGTGVTR